MTTKKLFLSVALVFGALATLPACKSQVEKDAELKSKVEAAAPNVNVTVSEGVVTISGTVNDEATRSNTEAAVKAVSGVKSVVNDLSVPPPVIINPDQTLIDGVNGILANYQGVFASVQDGVVTLTGELKRAELAGLMQAVNALRPKSVNNQLTIK
jgi:hyperosmotically inducible protein